MRLLAISDTPERLLYDNFSPERWRSKVDAVLSCGDLDHEYLEFLVSVLDVPLYYVAGNHDTGYHEHPPEGCENIDERVVRVGGLRIGGVQGSMRYNAGPDEYQYSERQMEWKMRRLGYRAWRAGGIDLVISHAAPLHCPTYRACPSPTNGGRACAHPELQGHLDACLDATDLCHRGFNVFRQFILRHRPRYWLHGHNHLTYGWMPRLSTIGSTLVINAFGHYVLDTEARLPIITTAAAPSELLRPT